jgi:hypothetical protein
MTIDVTTLIAVISGIALPSLGGILWLVRAIGKLSAGLASLGAAVDAFGVKLDGVTSDQDKSREARGEIRVSLADHDKRLSLTERDVERWLNGIYTPASTQGGRA